MKSLLEDGVDDHEQRVERARAYGHPSQRSRLARDDEKLTEEEDRLVVRQGLAVLRRDLEMWIMWIGKLSVLMVVRSVAVASFGRGNHAAAVRMVLCRILAAGEQAAARTPDTCSFSKICSVDDIHEALFIKRKYLYRKKQSRQSSQKG